MIKQRITKEQAAGILGETQEELKIHRRRALKRGVRLASSLISNVELHFVPTVNSGYYELQGSPQDAIDETVMNGFHDASLS